MRFLLINGPSRSGKDTLARGIEDWMMNDPDQPICFFDRFSMPIKRAFAGTIGAVINEYGEVAGWEGIKDTPHHLLGDKTYRQWQIDFSENFMKPLYSPDIFPKLLAERVEAIEERGQVIGYNGDPLMVIPDCGFQVEVDALLRYVPSARFILVRIHRPGFDFTGDSRDYVKGSPSVDVDNIGTSDDLIQWGINLIKEWK